MSVIETIMARHESILEKLQISTAGVNGYGCVRRWHVTLRVKQDVEKKSGLHPLKRDDYFKLIATNTGVRYQWLPEWTPVACAEADTEAEAMQALEPLALQWMAECMR